MTFTKALDVDQLPRQISTSKVICFHNYIRPNTHTHDVPTALPGLLSGR